MEKMVAMCNEGVVFDNCFIFSDCKSAIDIVCRQQDAFRRIEEFRRIWRSLRKLKNRQKEVRVVWTPGHAGIEYNEMADRLAKNASKKRSSEESISERNVFKMIKEKAIEQWNSSWQRSESGEWTKNLLRKAGRKIMFPRSRTIGMTYARALLNNAAVNDNLYRMRIGEDRECKCGESVETVEHVILECKEEEVSRKKLLEDLEEMWMSAKCTGGLNFNLEAILAPFYCDQLNQELSEKVLMKVFLFLGSLSRNL